MKPILVLVVALLLVGCGTVNWTSDQVARGVNTYCDRFTQLEREVMRSRVNLATHPDRIRIECAEDRRAP